MVNCSNCLNMTGRQDGSGQRIYRCKEGMLIKDDGIDKTFRQAVHSKTMRTNWETWIRKSCLLFDNHDEEANKCG